MFVVLRCVEGGVVGSIVVLFVVAQAAETEVFGRARVRVRLNYQRKERVLVDSDAAGRSPIKCYSRLAGRPNKLAFRRA